MEVVVTVEEVQASRPRTQDRRDRRRAEIVDSAAQLFARNGYNATGMNELCDAIGISKGALYHYTGSKDNILALIHERVMQEVTGEAEQIVARQLSAGERLRQLGQAQIRIIDRFPDHLRVFLHEYRALSGENARRFRERRRAFELLVEELLRAGVQSGEFDIEDIHLAVLGWLGMHNYAYLWFGSEPQVDLEVVAERFYEYFVHGIASR